MISKKKEIWSRPGSNRGPSACKADVITTTLQDHLKTKVKSLEYVLLQEGFFNWNNRNNTTYYTFD